MYNPEFAVRIEICQTDAEQLHEWRVVLGGAVRGGLSSAHGYIPTSGPLVLDAYEDMMVGLKSLVEAYLMSMTHDQLQLELS